MKLAKLIEATPEVLKFLRDVVEEYRNSVAEHGMFNSAHEGYSVTLEELDELWDEVRKKRKNRSLSAMRGECIQIASCAMKFALSVCSRESK